MRMKFRTVTADKVYPLMGVYGTVAVSRKGVFTIGWEVTLPTAYDVEEEEYDDMLGKFGRAIQVLPEWSVVHRQDFYVYEDYHSGESGRSGYLETCYNEHFEGRRYLTHKAYLFVSIAKKGHIDKAGKSSGLFGINGSIDIPSKKIFDVFRNKASEFVGILSSGSQLSFRVLEEADWLGDADHVGIVQRYMMLGNDSPIMSNIQMTPDGVSVYDKVAQAFVIGESDKLPTAIDSTSKVEELSTINTEVYLSYASKLGVLLDCEHVTNMTLVVPSQDEVIRHLERERNKMTSGLKSADNRINAGEIGEFLDDAYREGLFTAKVNLNVIAWGTEEESAEITGKISAAISAMHCTATYNNYNTPVIYYAGIPSNAFEIGKENLMLMELRSALTLCPYETFNNGMGKGTLRICDRMRNIPIRIDLKALARRLGYITNYNVFTLGGSGTGKSYLTNCYLRNCYDEDESVFVIDVGDSYEGLCAIIREESGGRDGAYLSWDREHPFSFNPFTDIDEWLSDKGGLNTDVNGVNFFLSFLMTAWMPEGGWSEHAKTALRQFIIDFIVYERKKKEKDIVFDHFYRFMDEQIVPRVSYSAPTKAKNGRERDKAAVEKDNRDHGYFIGNIQIDKEIIDIRKYVLALKNYSLTGSYGFLLNEPHPKDLFKSRFTVFEVDKLSQDDAKFYSICILCIMHAFETKMRGSSGFKNIVIDEAWKAIANETMAPYLAGLFKTTRKFNTSAMVVSQEIEDIVNSPVIKTAILDNSSIKILLDQSNHLNMFDKLQTMLSLTLKDKNIILSMNRNLNRSYRYKEVYFNLGGKLSFVAATETSPEEAVAYESEKDKKAPFLALAKELGSATRAIDRITGREERLKEKYK